MTSFSRSTEQRFTDERAGDAHEHNGVAASQAVPATINRIAENARPDGGEEVCGVALFDVLVAVLGREAVATVHNREDLLTLISCAVADIDRRVNALVNDILHHPRFQRLEASWRGLWRLLEYVDPDAPLHSGVKARILNVSKQELADDFEMAVDFDQSELFRKVYSEELDTPGGRPYGVLIGDYEITPDDLDLLEGVRGVAAAAFAPFVAMAHPSLLDVGATSFARLVERPFEIARAWEQPEFFRWKSFRSHVDSRFVGLTMPHVLQRLPYVDDGTQLHGFRFREDVSKREHLVWGSSACVFACVLARSYLDTGWFADVRGVRMEDATEMGGSGGLVTDLPAYWFETDSPGVAPRPVTDIVVTDTLERQLDQNGLIALSRCKYTPYAAFYGVPSVQVPKEYEGRDGASATASAQLSSMLHYILCASRFAHYIKVIWRDKIGSTAEAEEIQGDLEEWLSHYKSGRPLADARAVVRSRPDRPGAYACEIYLQPQEQFDAVNAQVVLRMEGPAKV